MTAADHRQVTVQVLYTQSINGRVVPGQLMIDEAADRVALLGYQVTADGKAILPLQGIVTLLEASTGQVLHRLAIGNHLRQMTLDPHRHHLYVRDTCDGDVDDGSQAAKPPGQLYQIDLLSGQVRQSITVGPDFCQVHYSAAQQALYVVFAPIDPFDFAIGVIDVASRQIHTRAQVPWMPAWFIDITEIRELLVLGARQVLVIDGNGRVKEVFSNSVEGSTVSYQGQSHNALYFVDQHGKDTYFSLTLPDYRSTTLLETDRSFIQVVDAEHATSYFLLRHQGNLPRWPIYSTALPPQGQMPLERGSLPLSSESFPLHYDASAQMWYFTIGVDYQESLHFKLVLVDLAAALADPTQEALVLPLEGTVQGTGFLADHRRVLVLHGDYAHPLVSLVEVTPRR